jgi:hypothetical protein
MPEIEPGKWSPSNIVATKIRQAHNICRTINHMFNNQIYKSVSLKDKNYQRKPSTVVRSMQREQFPAEIHIRCLKSSTRSLIIRTPRNATYYKKRQVTKNPLAALRTPERIQEPKIHRFTYNSSQENAAQIKRKEPI